MKRSRIAGVIVLILAAVVLTAGVFGATMQTNRGPFGGLLAEAEAVQAEIAGHQKLERRTASAVKKVGNAGKTIDAATGAAQSAMDAIDALNDGLSSGATGVELIDTLYASVTSARAGVGGAQSALELLETSGKQLLGEGGTLAAAVAGMRESLNTADGAMGDLDAAVADMVTQLYAEQYAAAFEKVSEAEELIAGLEGELSAIAGACEMEYAPTELAASEKLETGSAQEYADACAALMARAEELSASAEALTTAVAAAETRVADMEGLEKLNTVQNIVLTVQKQYIGVVFTALLLAVIGAVMAFLPRQFAHAWRKYPVFSTMIALLAMMVVQAYALGFGFDSFGAWGESWVSNAFNVLRANASVGMIALGMTMVVITGGIDLAVGSTLAGVGTVMMLLMDTSSRGLLGKLGITGVPAYVLGIAGGMATGLLIGAFIGMAVTKGRVPPFIVTLGVMNIVRSVAQYFTKSYSLKIPAEFSAIANTEILGERFLPILYWLVLAAIIYLVMKHTAFGRYVYAVGSNERTTRLSGINVDRVKMKVYALMGLIVSIASITQLARLGNMDVASAGSGYELDAIAAVVVGGTAMSGGKGSVIGTVLGMLIIGIMNNLLILLGVDSFLTNAFKGAIIIFAVLMQRKEREA